jgi:hypothetical protein
LRKIVSPEKVHNDPSQDKSPGISSPPLRVNAG